MDGTQLASKFDEFVELAENANRLFELIGGEIVEVPSNPYSSKIASRINRYLGTYVDNNDLGHVTGKAGGYVVVGERHALDGAFISQERQPELPQRGYNPHPPNLAAEVVSSTDTDKRLRIKIANYHAAAVLTTDEILSNFRLPINVIFAAKST